MNEIENNLSDLKSDYEAIRYPGDLSAEVPLDIAPPAVAGRIGAFLALAAALALGVTCYVLWTPSTPQQNNVAVKNPTNSTDNVAVVVPGTAKSKQDIASTETPSLIVSIPAREESSFEAPSWTDVTPTNAYNTDMSASMPYQSIAVPTVNEIDQIITNQNQQSSTKQG